VPPQRRHVFSSPTGIPHAEHTRASPLRMERQSQQLALIDPLQRSFQPARLPSTPAPRNIVAAAGLRFLTGCPPRGARPRGLNIAPIIDGNCGRAGNAAGLLLRTATGGARTRWRARPPCLESLGELRLSHCWATPVVQSQQIRRGMSQLGHCRTHASQETNGRLLGYSITSSARASSVGGTSRPSALAVLRLMTRSNLVGTRRKPRESRGRDWATPGSRKPPCSAGRPYRLLRPAERPTRCRSSASYKRPAARAITPLPAS
jgi:hypothetical protein